MVQALDNIEVQDLPHAVKLLSEMNTNVQQVTELVDNMLLRVKNGEITTAKGLSFLEMKYHMLLSYLINLTYIVLRKCSGEQIECDPAIDRLIEIRTILEKIRPIDSKLKYQIDKLVKTAMAGSSNEQDPSCFKAKPSNLVSKFEDDDEDSGDDSGKEENEEKEVKKGIYVPPKLAAVHYDGDKTTMERNLRQMERAKKRALSSSVMQELKEEYLDSPTEIIGGSRAQQAISKKQKEREDYEETYLTRLPVTKQEKHRQRKLTTLGTLGEELTQFGDYAALEGGSSSTKKRKNKSISKKRKSKKMRFH